MKSCFISEVCSRYETEIIIYKNFDYFIFTITTFPSPPPISLTSKTSQKFSL